MPSRLTYADAVRLLGGAGPLVSLADTLLGGALSLATAGGSEVALSFFDAKGEVIRLGHQVATTLNDRVRGLGRYDRTQRLHAAHGVLVVTAFFEAFDDCLGEAGWDVPGLSREDQLRLAGTASTGDWMERLVSESLPMPSADRTYDRLLAAVGRWAQPLAVKLATHLTGLAAWDRAGENRQLTVESLLGTRLPALATERYDASVRRLAVEIPEFAFWMRQTEERATARGLAALETELLRVSSRTDPARQRAVLAAVYRADLDRPVLGGDTGDLAVPHRQDAYLDPVFRVRQGGTGARPAADDWWSEVEPRGDLAGFLAAYLTTPAAAEVPMLLLGQPGAGKSTLTKVLAARLPAADFLVVRVALREVNAEAAIQDQVEQALRSAIGEDVSWSGLAGEANGAMPVILLDGFDELLMTTGLHQSDYLQQVVDFQRRETILGRPVAVMVTSRVAVADRARMPGGSLVVRLEPFTEEQIGQWAGIWNRANPDFRQLTPAGLHRFPDLAAQPLLLLMLALYNATGPGLPHDDEDFDEGLLYERLLTEFAAREVGRVHDGRPESALPALVEEELLRLSVVAFAMFHRMRLWVTTTELDADLAGLGLQPSRTAATAGFRTPITAGEEMVGRFFFIQRAEALRDDRRLQTYEFLHATFGEYLIARLVVHAVRDAAARAAARTLRLGQAEEDELLRSLLGFTPLTARNNVLSFAAAMLGREDTPALRAWLVDRLRVATTRPHHAPGTYQPVDRRADHWMAIYSFNLMLLTVACGTPLSTVELYPDAPDPARILRDSALQWQAACPIDLWLDSFRRVSVHRRWTADGRLDFALEWGVTLVADAGVDPFWSHGSGHDPQSRARRYQPGTGFGGYFELDLAVTSMNLTSALSDDVLRHALGPFIDHLPQSLTHFIVHDQDDTESVAHSLVHLWLTSALREGPVLAEAYQRAVLAVTGFAWSPHLRATAITGPAVTVVLRMLAGDVDRLPPATVLDLIGRIRDSPYYSAELHAGLVGRCLRGTGGTDPSGDVQR
ncbi:AAA family ATPase [Actinoplanes sp. NPDC051851]|uniref:NACHT domain-containing protein n=1 Tax=Actinoplanes sp. NPDC051851 TaxID=3154753 RepID=UPI003434CFD7